MRLGILSDTHSFLNPKLYDALAGVDAILHAGDICGDELLDDLQILAPVFAVSGNMDGTPTVRRPQRFSREFEGVRVCMTHGHFLDPRVYCASARALFAADNPRLIVYGHSHRAKLETCEGVTCLNPGSAGHARFGDKPSAAIVVIGPDGELECQFIKL
jgi:uncharacterized protein